MITHLRPAVQVRLIGGEKPDPNVGMVTIEEGLPVQRLGMDMEPFITELQFLGSLTGGSNATLSMTMTFHDKTFTTVEDGLFLRSKGNRNLDFRWGYPSLNKWTIWRRVKITDITPTFTTGGETIAVSGIIDGNGYAGIVVSYTFKGTNFGEMVQEAARWMGYENVFVEPTIDKKEYNPISTGNVPIKDFIKKVFLPVMESAETGEIGYEWVESDGRGVVVKALTSTYSDLYDRRKWSFLAGHALSDEVISFTPEYESSSLGSVGIAGIVVEGYDRVTKRQWNGAVNDNLVAREVPRFTSSPVYGSPDPDNPENTDFGIRVMLDRDNTEDLRSEAFSFWKSLSQHSAGATLNLLGNPELINLLINDYVEMDVIIMNPETKEIRKHWSSGRYQVREVIHTVGMGYNIECKLMRDSSQGVNVGTERKKTATTMVDVSKAKKMSKDGGQDTIANAAGSGVTGEST